MKKIFRLLCMGFMTVSLSGAQINWEESVEKTDNSQLIDGPVEFAMNMDFCLDQTMNKWQIDSNEEWRQFGTLLRIISGTLLDIINSH